jgi:hypothetical protein
MPTRSDVRLSRGQIARALGWGLLSVLSASGCVRAHARTTPEPLPLDVPAAPPREVQAAGTDVPQPVALPEEPRRTPLPPRPAPRPDPPRAGAARPEAPAQPAEIPKAVEESPRPAATLQTQSTAEQADAERVIRATITRALDDLKRVNPRTLNADARTQYDSVKRFVDQAEDAIRTKNLVLAKNLADKAAAIAASQAGR